LNRRLHSPGAAALSIMRGPRRSGKLPMIEKVRDSVDEGSLQTSEGNAFDPDDAHHHGETCTCNLRGE
jgi:hypothetical protein